MCVSECPATTGSPIALYDVDGKTPTAFTYTQIQTDRIGKFCYPVEPTPRKLVEEYLTTPLKYGKRVVGELFLVTLCLTKTFDVVALALVIANALSFAVLFGLRKQTSIKLVVWGSISISVLVFEIFGYFCYQKYTEVGCPTYPQDHLGEVFVWREPAQLWGQLIGRLPHTSFRVLGIRCTLLSIDGLLLQSS